MSHLPHETLWGLSRGELEPEAATLAEQHLASCIECSTTLVDVQLAQRVLMDLPAVPPMPDAMARRVGQELAEVVDARAAKKFSSWWLALFTPRFVLAAAFGVTLVVIAAWLLANSAQPTTEPTLAVTQPQPSVPVPVAPVRKTLSVTVASARKSSVKQKQVLAEGATVATNAGGSLWMKLPDGSRAGLTSASQVTLATLDAKQLTLDIAHGSLAMVVPHREDRVLTVRAGELEVKDLGTRFLVSRAPSHTVVAVEEGVVEVKTPTGTRNVSAGHAVTWRDGRLSEMDWETTPAPAPKFTALETPEIPTATLTPEPAVPPTPDSIARLEEEDDDAPLPPVDEDVAAVETATAQPPDQTPLVADEREWKGLPPKPTTTTLPPLTRRAPKERGLSLRNIERKLREFGSALTSSSGREARARNIVLAGEANDCEHALRLADLWLAEPLTNAGNEVPLRAAVQQQQVRCLNRLGRSEEATALQKSLAAPQP